MKLNFIFIAASLLLFSNILIAQETDSLNTPIEGLKYKQQPGLALAASKIFFSDKRYSISGFGELNYVRYFGEQLRESNDLELYYTNLYRAAMFFGYRFTDKIIWNSELQIELLHDRFDEVHYEPLIEAFVDFLIHDKFKARAGFYPLTIGYTNNNDEPVMFYSVNRYEVERIITPSTWIEFGAMFYGNITDDLSYALGLSQGLQAKNYVSGTWLRQGREIRFDLPKSISINPQLTYSGLTDFTFSISGYYGPSGQLETALDPANNLNTVAANVNLTTGYVKYETERMRFISIGSYGRLSDTDLIYDLTQQKGENGSQVLGEQTYGYLFEFGYDILPWIRKPRVKEKKTFFYDASKAKLPVFARYERVDTHFAINSGLQSRLMSNPQDFIRNDLHIWVIGANYNTKENIVFKVNYQFRNNLANDRDGDILEFGFGFIF